MHARFATLLTLCAVTLACSGSPSGPSGPTGQFSLMLTDSPFSDAQAVLVTFSAVSVHKDTDLEFTTVPFVAGPTRTCDLKKLQDAQDILGVGSLTAGKYTQVRLVVSEARLFFDNPSAGDACAASIPAPAGASGRRSVAAWNPSSYRSKFARGSRHRMETWIAGLLHHGESAV